MLRLLSWIVPERLIEAVPSNAGDQRPGEPAAKLRKQFGDVLDVSAASAMLGGIQWTNSGHIIFKRLGRFPKIDCTLCVQPELSSVSKKP